MSAHKPHWESLPTEISLSILKQLPDLTSLHHCLEASPATARIFDAYSAEIIEAILASGALHKYTCAIVRMAACVRFSSPPAITNLATFQKWYAHETTDYHYNPPRWTLPPLRLAQQFDSGSEDAVVVPASILRGVLASHVRNESLMIGCLSTYLARFRSLQPMHIAGENQYFTWKSEFRGQGPTNFVGAWQLQPPTVLVDKHDIGPPTWCEEQRVLRALWRVQLFEDLKAAKCAGRLKDWSHAHPWQDLEEILNQPWVNLLEEENHAYFQQRIYVEEQLVYTVLDYIDSMAEAAVESTAAPCTMSTKRGWPVPSSSQQDILEVEHFRSGIVLTFEKIHGDRWDYVALGQCSPLQHVPWDFYRRRGFAIWCDLRMLVYGLLPAEYCSSNAARAARAMRSVICDGESLHMAWKSVLTNDELAEVARINQERQADAWSHLPQFEVSVEYLIEDMGGDTLERNMTPDIYRQSGPSHDSNA